MRIFKNIFKTKSKVIDFKPEVKEEKPEPEARETDPRPANEFFLKEDQKEYAFTCKGVDYYRFKDSGIPITYMRLKAAQEVIAHASELRVTEPILDEYQHMIDVYTGKRTGDNRVSLMTAEEKLAQISQANAIMWQRRKIGDNLSSLYYLASVFYFDETEDPAGWDKSYADHKIREWLGDHETEAFFLRSLPLHTVISPDLLEDGMTDYLQELILQQYTHSVHNLSMLSETDRDSEVGTNILLLAEISMALKSLNEKGLLRSTTT